MSDKMREEFERWFLKATQKEAVYRDGDSYVGKEEQDCWAARQASQKRMGPIKTCECGPQRNITEGGHYAACTRCHRRIKPC